MLCDVCYDWPVVSRPFIVFFDTVWGLLPGKCKSFMIEPMCHCHCHEAIGGFVTDDLLQQTASDAGSASMLEEGVNA